MKVDREKRQKRLNEALLCLSEAKRGFSVFVECEDGESMRSIGSRSGGMVMAVALEALSVMPVEAIAEVLQQLAERKATG